MEPKPSRGSSDVMETWCNHITVYSTIYQESQHDASHINFNWSSWRCEATKPLAFWAMMSQVWGPMMDLFGGIIRLRSMCDNMYRILIYTVYTFGNRSVLVKNILYEPIQTSRGFSLNSGTWLSDPVCINMFSGRWRWHWDVNRSWWRLAAAWAEFG